jgi:hypothetical protein
LQRRCSKPDAWEKPGTSPHSRSPEAVRLTIACAPGSDPGDARTRASAFVPVDGPAALAAAAANSGDAYVLFLGPGARPLPGAFGGLTAALDAGPGVLGGVTVGGGVRLYGWMLAPAPAGPLPFELAPVTAGPSERGVDAAVRGAIDVVAPGMFLARRELLLDPLPDDPVAAMVELCARARDAGSAVVCRPAFACEAPADTDDRGRLAAVRAVAERRPELAGKHRLPPGLRRTHVDRALRLSAGRYATLRVPRPPLTVLASGPDTAAALRAEMRVRGDRYVLVADSAVPPDAEALDLLVAALEEGPYVALAAPEAAALDGSCVLIAVGRFPQHVEPTGATIGAAVATLIAAAAELRLAVRAPGYLPPPPRPPLRRTATAIFLASSLPEITRMSLDAVLVGIHAGDEAVAVVAERAETVRRLLAAHPRLRIEGDAADPLLSVAANRAISAATTDLVFLIADDVLISAGSFDRLRAAFDRVPALGAAFAAVPGAAGGEGVLDAGYPDLAHMRQLAEERARTRAHELEPIEVGMSPVVVLAREALEVVGGIDPALGPTRRGIADLTARLRTAGYAVARCDDALAHRFDVSVSRNPAAAADAGQPVPAAPDATRLAGGFDPATRVSFVAPAAPAPAVTASHAIAVPVGGADELERAARVVGAAAAAFDARSPVRIHVLLDGTVSAAEAVARLRPVLAARGLPLDETVAVRVERVTDLVAWRAGVEPAVRTVLAAGHERTPLDGLPIIAASSIAGLLAPVAR